MEVGADPSRHHDFKKSILRTHNFFSKGWRCYYGTVINEKDECLDLDKQCF